MIEPCEFETRNGFSIDHISKRGLLCTDFPVRALHIAQMWENQRHDLSSPRSKYLFQSITETSLHFVTREESLGSCRQGIQNREIETGGAKGTSRVRVVCKAMMRYGGLDQTTTKIVGSYVLLYLPPSVKV